MPCSSSRGTLAGDYCKMCLCDIQGAVALEIGILDAAVGLAPVAKNCLRDSFKNLRHS